MAFCLLFVALYKEPPIEEDLTWLLHVPVTNLNQANPVDFLVVGAALSGTTMFVHADRSDYPRNRWLHRLMTDEVVVRKVKNTVKATPLYAQSRRIYRRVMTALCRNCLAVFLLLFSTGGVLSAELVCRLLQITEISYPGPDEFGQGLLWKVTREGLPSSYVFGTIHVADRDVSAKLDMIRDLWADSEVFVTEAVPVPADIALFRQMMFFDDDRKLQDVISTDLYAKTLALLSEYHLSERDVSAMKPWAAFLTMSYPAGMGFVLDQQLLRLARDAGISARGLESVVEQGSLFDSFSLADQVRLLNDAVLDY